ncbi:MAG: hypothetical protein M0Z53_12155 [Thermaerobacter sp.]|nr:hypothetical protein [Thermaerobacter sp.]
MIDLHAHVLPNLDDGPRNLEQTAANLRQAASAGIHTLVAVAHTNDNHYQVTAQAYWEAFNAVREWVFTHDIPIALVSAMEVRLGRNLAQGFCDQAFLPVGESGYLCVELPSLDFPSYTLDSLYELGLSGVRPFLIHPERNRGLRKMPELGERLMAMGIMGVASMGSLTGQFGEEVQAAGWRLIDQGLIQAVATDGHSVDKRPLTLPVAYDLLKDRYGETVAEDMTGATPAKLLQGQSITLRPHFPAKRPLLKRLLAKRP